MDELTYLEHREIHSRSINTSIDLDLRFETSYSPDIKLPSKFSRQNWLYTYVATKTVHHLELLRSPEPAIPWSLDETPVKKETMLQSKQETQTTNIQNLKVHETALFRATPWIEERCIELLRKDIYPTSKKKKEKVARKNDLQDALEMDLNSLCDTMDTESAQHSYWWDDMLSLNQI